MNKIYGVVPIVIVSVVLLSCDGGPKITNTGDGSKTNGELVASIANGKIYYDDNCGVCHAAGTEDPSSAFSASNLIKSVNIARDMSQYVYTTTNSTTPMMGRFSDIGRQRVLDLNAYLSKVE